MTIKCRTISYDKSLASNIHSPQKKIGLQFSLQCFFRLKKIFFQQVYTMTILQKDISDAAGREDIK